MSQKNWLHMVGALFVSAFLLSAAASGAMVISGDLSFEDDPSVLAGSGQLDILLFTGNAVSNPAGIPQPNGAMPSGGSTTFTGNWPVAGDSETLTVAEALAHFHSNLGPDYNEFVILFDANEPNSASTKMLTIVQLTITVGSTTFSTADPVVLNGSGSGRSNYLIRGITPLGINLTAFNPSDTISLHLQMSDLHDGFEEFFVGALEGPYIPEPATVGFLGLGLALMGIRRLIRGRAA